MRLRAEIVIEIDAPDFVVAAEHQRRVEVLHEAVRQAYPQASMLLRERKERIAARQVQAARPVMHQTGRLHAYAD
jgi:hypothetical protein